ncbi:MAG: hypothetical protein K0T99_02145 [Alphaproteobacteria bacterium]|nr:hypothetical protein [Alphaproteobacteria bacterium]
MCRKEKRRNRTDQEKKLEQPVEHEEQGQAAAAVAAPNEEVRAELADRLSTLLAKESTLIVELSRQRSILVESIKEEQAAAREEAQAAVTNAIPGTQEEAQASLGSELPPGLALAMALDAELFGDDDVL